MAEVMEFTTRSRPIKLNGQPGLMVIAPKKYTSELGNELAKISGGFGLVYYVENTGVVRCSLRSVAPFNIQPIAQKFGGGGHKQAGAFRCKNLDLFNELITQEGNTFKLKLI